jgi:iron complex outermembrane recepter protein
MCISFITRLAFRNGIFVLSALTVFPHTVSGQDVVSIHELKKLSIEELMQIEVTSVTKTPQKLTTVASAIQVITNEDIQRSGVTNIAEALRLVTNLQVAQLQSNAWIVSARGFNTVFANKLLVLIDGRSVYTPLFAGVLWDQQHVLLEDVERIEVISGPGGSLWGVNAVNGVINIITKKAIDSQGLYASVGLGSFLEKTGALRYGARINDKLFFRVYGQYQERGNTFLPDGADNTDSWKVTSGGFRVGYYPTKKDFITVQGDVYAGERTTTPEAIPFDGQSILTRWTHARTETSNYVLQLYYDRYWRDDLSGFADELETFDLDLQYAYPMNKNHHFLLGAGYRYVVDKGYNRSPFVGLLPETRTMPVYSGFVQDEISLSTKWKMILGAKFLHNVFSNFEIQPSARVAWSLDNSNTLWSSVSYAVRAPSRLDRDYYLPLAPQPSSVPSVAGGPNFDSEKLIAYELGYKIQPNSRSSFSLATFYHDYADVYSVEPLPGTLTYQIQNGSEAESWGAELSGFYQVSKLWRVRGGFTYFDKDLRPKSGRAHDPSYLANDVKHQAMMQSMLDLPFHFKIDVVARYLDYITASFATVRVPEYFTFDARVAWLYENYELAVVGQNLASDRHSEFGAAKIPRSIYGKFSVRF